jgi:hypothetical protein
VRSYLWAKLLRGSPLPPTARHVGHVLATYMNEKGECWPTVRTVAEDVGVSPRTVQRGLDDLCRYGLIEIVRRTGRANVYRARRPAWLAGDGATPDTDGARPPTRASSTPDTDVGHKYPEVPT